MSYNDKPFLSGRGKLFKPKVERRGSNIDYASSFNSYKSNKDFSHTNIESTSSFRYGTKKGVVSTQELKIDFSKFENHTFFHSAVAKTNEAFDIVINKFPFDGDNKEIENFQDNLTGFEKYVYDQFPKNVGYINFTGSNSLGSKSSYVKVIDGTGLQYPDISRNKKGTFVLDPKDNSFTIEAHIKLPVMVNSDQVFFQKKESESSMADHITLSVTGSHLTNTADILFSISSGSTYLNVKAPIEKGKFNYVAAVYDRISETSTLYINTSSYVSHGTQLFDNLNFSSNFLTIGSGSNFRSGSQSADIINTLEFTGSIDEFRYFKSARSLEQIKKYQYKSLDFNSLTERNQEENLTLYYKFNEPYGTYSGNGVVFDHSGNSLHASITNFLDICRLTGSDNPVKFEEASLNPVLFPNFDKIGVLNTALMTTASFYDDVNPNLITRLVPAHYFLEGNEAEGFNDILGTFKDNFSGGSLPNQEKFKSAQLLTVFLLIWAKFFDEIKLYIDAVSNLKNVSYENFDITPDSLLYDIGKINGIELPSLFKGANLEQLFKGINYTDNPKQSQLSLLTIQNTIWRRILISLPYLKRRKGTLESIKSIFRSVGVEPDNIFTIREYGGSSYNKIDHIRDEKIDIIKMLNFSGSNADVSVTLNAQGRADKKPALKSGFLSGSRIEIGEPKHIFEQSRGRITFNASHPLVYNNETIEITDITRKTVIYKFIGNGVSPAQEEIISTDNGINTVAVNIYGLSTLSSIRLKLKNAINSTNGHGPEAFDFSSPYDYLFFTDRSGAPFVNNSDIKYTYVGTAGISEVTRTTAGSGILRFKNNNFHGISNIPSTGLFTSGSFTYEGQYYFDKNKSHPVTQSLARLHTTGSSEAGWEGLIANLIYNRTEQKLTLQYHDSPTDNKTELTIYSASLINNELYNISFGYDREVNFANTGSLFLRVGRQESGKIYNLQTTSSFVTGSEDSVFRNISAAYNASGSFIAIGSQSINTATSKFLNQDSESIKTEFSGFVTNIKFFSKKVSDEEFKAHTRDPLSHGVQDPLKNYLFENAESGSFERLRLLSDTKQHTSASDPNGNIRIFDFTQNNIHLEGSGFEPSKLVVSPIYLNFKKLSSNFDISIADSKIRIRSLDDKIRRDEHFYSQDLPVYEVPPSEATLDDPRFSIDMSVMKGLNEQIMKIFSDYSFFDNALGNANLHFDNCYPDLIKMRRLYFNNVLEKIDLGKYSQLFKWIDSTLTDLIFDMIPYNTRFMGINFVYENHVLDRNRFRYHYNDIFFFGEKIKSIGNSTSTQAQPEAYTLTVPSPSPQSIEGSRPSPEKSSTLTQDDVFDISDNSNNSSEVNVKNPPRVRDNTQYGKKGKSSTEIFVNIIG